MDEVDEAEIELDHRQMNYLILGLGNYFTLP